MAYLWGAGFEEPVEAEAPVVSDGSLELVPLAIAQLMNLAQNEAVLLLCVGLALVGTVLQLQLLQQQCNKRVALLTGQQLSHKMGHSRGMVGSAGDTRDTAEAISP